MQKVLVITYYWPPAGGPGVQRWLKFIMYLKDFGVEPIVFVPENPHYPIQDESLIKEVPNRIEVITQPIIEPYGIASIFSTKKTKRISSGIIQDAKKQSFLERFFLWIRGNYFIPDARKYWVKPSAKRLKKILLEQNINTVITTGPPHSVHLIGKELKEKIGVRWIADFRDPWTSIGYHKKLKLSRAAQRKHQRLEKAVLNSADALVVTSKSTKSEFETITSKPISVITNGFDGESKKEELDQRFTISHIGSLLTARNPKDLWIAVSELAQANEAFRKDIKIQLIGVVGDGVMESIRVSGLEKHVEIMGYVSHDEVLNYQAKSQLLLLLEIDSPETRGIIPGKLFEYFNAGRPILAIGPNNWEAGQMVEDHKAGDYLVHGNAETIKKLLLKRFQQFQNGKLNCSPTGIERYHRRELTKELAKLLTWESS